MPLTKAVNSPGQSFIYGQSLQMSYLPDSLILHCVPALTCWGIVNYVNFILFWTSPLCFFYSPSYFPPPGSFMLFLLSLFHFSPSSLILLLYLSPPIYPSSSVFCSSMLCLPTEIPWRGIGQRGEECLRLWLVQQRHARGADRSAAQAWDSHRRQAELCQTGQGVRHQEHKTLGWHTQYLINTQTQCHIVRETSQKVAREGRGLINRHDLIAYLAMLWISSKAQACHIHFHLWW